MKTDVSVPFIVEMGMPAEIVSIALQQELLTYIDYHLPMLDMLFPEVPVVADP